MYTDDDLDAAVRAGDITPEGAAAIRRSAADRVAARRPDDVGAEEGERLRLVTGFHDISVAGAALLTLACMLPFTAPGGTATASLVAAAVAWGLAEHFSRVRRLALTSIVLMLVIVAAAGGVAFGIADPRGSEAGRLFLPRGGLDMAVFAHRFGVPVAAMAAAALAHWLRFRVPAAMGMVAATAAALALATLIYAVPAAASVTKPLAFAAGLVVFTFAMRWDLSDPARRTIRSDVAFWLHIAAAPLIVGPAFAAIGAQLGTVSPGTAAAAVGLYVALSLVALAIDRRALMASALFYLLAAVGSLMAAKGPFLSTVALTGLAVGPALLLLSAFWGDARRAVLARVPAPLARRLPPLPAGSPKKAAAAA